MSVPNAYPWAPSPVALSDEKVARIRELAVRSSALADQVEGLLEDVKGPYREAGPVVCSDCVHGNHASTEEWRACEDERQRIYEDIGAQPLADAWFRIADAASYFTS